MNPDTAPGTQHLPGAGTAFQGGGPYSLFVFLRVEESLLSCCDYQGGPASALPLLIVLPLRTPETDRPVSQTHNGLYHVLWHAGTSSPLSCVDRQTPSLPRYCITARQP